MNKEIAKKIEEYSKLANELKENEKKLNTFYEPILSKLKNELTEELNKNELDTLEFLDTFGNKYVLSYKTPSPSPMIDEQVLREYCNANDIDYTQFLKLKNTTPRFVCKFKLKE